MCNWEIHFTHKTLLVQGEGDYLGLRNIKSIQTRVMKKYIILTHLPALVYTLRLIRAAKEYSPSKWKLLDEWYLYRKDAFVRNYFKNLIYFPCSEYTFSLVSFIVHNINKFQTNSAIHSINMRPQHHQHVPDATLMSYEKCKYYAGTTLCSGLPSKITV